jgi:hypothetical protein
LKFPCPICRIVLFSTLINRNRIVGDF